MQQRIFFFLCGVSFGYFGLFQSVSLEFCMCQQRSTPYMRCRTIQIGLNVGCIFKAD